MSLHPHKLSNFMQRPWQDKILVGHACMVLGLSRVAALLVPMRHLINFFGTHMLETSQDAPLEHLREAKRIAWAINSISPYTPWKSNCYAQAMSAKYFLSRKGIPCTLYLGAAFKKNGEKGLEAHAWVRCGTLYVTGGKGHTQFGTVGIFGS